MTDESTLLHAEADSFLVSVSSGRPCGRRLHPSGTDVAHAPRPASGCTNAILHVVDLASPAYQDQMYEVEKILGEMGLKNRPRLLVFIVAYEAEVAKARDRAGVYIIFTASLLITFQFLVNILMIIGLFPVVGITLPFLSYGGSSLLSSYVACGLVLNVKMRRFANV